MKTLTAICTLLIAFTAATVRAESAGMPGPASGKGTTADLIAQYIPDDTEGGKKQTIGDLMKKESAKVRPKFVLGIGGGLDAREGFASIAASVPMGMQYGNYSLTFSPAYTYMSGKSIKTKTGPVDRILRTKTSGQVYEFTLPAMFTYSILDLPAHLYTPYVTGGAGYSYRKFSLSGYSLVSRISRISYLHSMTLNYGFGFLVRTSDDTRFNIGLTCQSYFNKRNGPFDYDTTGAGLQFGFMIIIN
ncbi:MAG TPA: hypothetical protein PK307_01765 [Spirochaetota bacterium]|nr:hypothetical protein [Spirochaetota bacterium]HOD15468.1 hypothetical protein [Spirochaetota bacterium]HPG51737.1 hypothetical protein [Spirochaetota bacterium]HPN13020.1 hypothetical protein [Spirochaetota bacterium]HQL80901.1 hypothetical protein [Spirochaetota bacterium]